MRHAGSAHAGLRGWQGPSEKRRGSILFLKTGPLQASPEDGWQRWGSTGSSVCFAGIYSLQGYIVFRSRKVLYWMERVL